MTRFLLKRIGLALITLFLLSVIVFGISTILPGDVGRAVLGPFATQESVDALNEQLGTDRSVFVQYVDWAGGLLQGDLGTSLTKQVPTWDLLDAGARELVQARVRRVPHLRPALDPRRRGRGAALRQVHRQVDHAHGHLARRDAGVRHGDRPDPRVRNLARLAPGDRAGGGGGECADTDRSTCCCRR